MPPQETNTPPQESNKGKLYPGMAKKRRVATAKSQATSYDEQAKAIEASASQPCSQYRTDIEESQTHRPSRQSARSAEARKRRNPFFDDNIILPGDNTNDDDDDDDVDGPMEIDQGVEPDEEEGDEADEEEGVEPDEEEEEEEEEERLVSAKGKEKERGSSSGSELSTDSAEELDEVARTPTRRTSRTEAVEPLVAYRSPGRPRGSLTTSTFKQDVLLMLEQTKKAVFSISTDINRLSGDLTEVQERLGGVEDQVQELTGQASQVSPRQRPKADRAPTEVKNAFSGALRQLMGIRSGDAIPEYPEGEDRARFTLSDQMDLLVFKDMSVNEVGEPFKSRPLRINWSRLTANSPFQEALVSWAVRKLEAHKDLYDTEGTSARAIATACKESLRSRRSRLKTQELDPSTYEQKEAVRKKEGRRNERAQPQDRRKKGSLGYLERLPG